jgi:hypothetical protein
VKIERFVLHRVNLPLRRSHKWAGLTEPVGHYLLLRLARYANQAWSNAVAAERVLRRLTDIPLRY